MDRIEQLEEALKSMEVAKKEKELNIDAILKEEEKARKAAAAAEERLKKIRAKQTKLNRLKAKINNANQRKAENHRKYTYGGLIVKYADWIDVDDLERILAKYHDELQQAKQSLPYKRI